MRKDSKVILVCVFLLLQAFCGELVEGKTADTLRLNLKVYFERGMSAINPYYKDNGVRMKAYAAALQRIAANDSCHVTSVSIRAGASPDGNTRLNQELSEARTRSLFIYYDSLFQSKAHSHEVSRLAPVSAVSVGENWEGLAGALQTVREPWATQALDIVRNTPVWVLDDKGVVVDSRKNQLKNLSGGTAWSYMDRYLFDDNCSVGEICTSFLLSSSFVGTSVGEAGLLVSADLPPAEDESAVCTGADTLEIRFRLDSVQVDLNFGGNRSRVHRFLRSASKRFEGVNPDALQWDIYAGASPEGPADHNEWLGQERGNAIRKLIRDSLGVRTGTFVMHNSAARWDDFYKSVAASDEPWRDDVLRIIRKSPSADRTARDRREVMLRALNGGMVWPVLLKKYLAPLRSGGSAIVTYHPERDTLDVPSSAAGTAAVASGVAVREMASSAPVNAPATVQALPRRNPVQIFRPVRYASAHVSDTLEVLFRLDSTRIDRDFGGNRERISRFVQAYHTNYSQYNPDAVQIDIYAGASPEGTGDHNRWLGQSRGNSIRRLIRDSLGIRYSNIFVHNMAARWDDFYDAVADSNEPWRDEVLAIIGQEPSKDGSVRDHREAKLRALHGGKVWPVLLDKYLAPLRSGGSAVISYIPERDVYREVQRDTVYKHYYFFGSYPFGGCCPNTPFRSGVGVFPPVFVPYTGTGTEETKPAQKEREKPDIRPAWAIKTNLLFWGVVAPNVQVEFPLGRKNRWSLEVEYDHPWFIWNKNANASQILNLGLELRLYLGNRYYRRWLDGWHIGLAVSGGKYDWEWKQHEGWQGEFINAYFNVGYQHRFGKHWAVDAGLGVGVIPSRYRHYYGGSVYPDNHLEPWDIHLIYHDKGQFFFPGATHINVSIAYMFNNWPVRFKTMKGRKLERWTEERNAEIQRYEMRREQKEAERLAKQKAKEEAEYARELEKEMKKAARAARKNK